MAGRGRGRGMTLPAWMTRGDGSKPSPGGAGAPAARAAPAMQPAPAAAAAAPAPAGEWKEYRTPQGRPYWYSTVTKKTQWDRPAALGGAAPAAAQPAAAPAAAAAAAPAAAKPAAEAAKAIPWKRYTTPEGRPYYYNKETKQTTWKVPPDYAAQLEPNNAAAAAPAAQAQAQQQAPAATTTAAAPQQQQAAPQQQQQQQAAPQQSGAGLMGGPAGYIARANPALHAMGIETEADRERAFAAMLSERRIGIDWDWEAVMRLVMEDARYRVFPTATARRRAYEKWCRENRDTIAEQRKAEKDALHALLKAQWATFGAEPIREEVFAKLKGNEVVENVRYEQDRRRVFHAVEREVADAQRAERRANREKYEDALLKRLQATDSITVDTSFRAAMEQLGDAEEVKALRESDRVHVFERHMRRLERAHKEERRRLRDEKYRRERKNRDAFRELLATRVAAGELTVKTRWHELAAALAGDARLTAMEGQSGSTARELFWDARDDLKDEAVGKAREVVRLMKEGKVAITPATTLEQLAALAGELEPLKGMHAHSLEVVHERVRSKAERLAARAFAAMLRKHGEVTPDMTWAQAAAVVGETFECAAVPEARRELLFTRWAERARRGRDSDAGSSDDEHGRSRSHRKRSRERSSSSSSRDHKRRR